jgi:hypothetical protein
MRHCHKISLLVMEQYHLIQNAVSSTLVYGLAAGRKNKLATLLYFLSYVKHSPWQDPSPFPCGGAQRAASYVPPPCTSIIIKESVSRDELLG